MGEAPETAAAPVARPSLVHRPPRLAPDGLLVRSLSGEVSMSPAEGREIVVGRDVDEVHVGLGVDDASVSRRHLVIRRSGTEWLLHNEGRRTARLPTGALLPGGEAVPVAHGYTAAFVQGTGRRTHLLELYLSDGSVAMRVRPDQVTTSPAIWPLDAEERLVMLVLGQRYLRHEPRPQPLSWQDAVDELCELDPEEGWTRKRIERKVNRLRDRLARRGVPYLRAEEIVGPLGNQLNHNLITELVTSTSLLASELAELDARLDSGPPSITPG